MTEQLGEQLKVTVVGTGLMGGSIAGGLRKRGIASVVIGVEPNPERAQAALATGAVDTIAGEVPADADVVVLCPPSDKVAGWVHALADHPGLVVDVGSVKQAIIDDVQALLPQFPAQFVPSHPIAGSEKRGAEYADPDLLVGQWVVLTPVAANTAVWIERARQFWTSLDAHVAVLDAAEHDTVLAQTSHLPHLLASVYMQQVSFDQLPYTGGGFRDFSRIAASNPEMWWRIFKLNKPALLAALTRFEADLGALRRMLEAEDDAAGVQKLTDARALRIRLEDAKGEPQ